MAERILDKNQIPGLTVTACRETFFFSGPRGRLCQWVELDLTWNAPGARVLFQIATPGLSATITYRLRAAAPGETLTVRCLAPLVWPRPPVRDARLVIRSPEGVAEGRITVGSHRPWTIYLLSDLCADDTWAYENLKKHDRDDCLTTLAELRAGSANRYNFATVYQVERFLRDRSPGEKTELKRALRQGRFHVTPVPNQLNCGAFNLAAYPLLLEPYSKIRAEVSLPDRFSRDAYHMEAPTWTAGLPNLLSCAGFRSFGKSMPSYDDHAPWVERLRSIPRLTRLEVAPGRFVYLLLCCGGYSEGRLSAQSPLDNADIIDYNATAIRNRPKRGAPHPPNPRGASHLFPCKPKKTVDFPLSPA